MPPYDAERLEVANEVHASLALENVLTPIQARSFVRSLQTTWQVPTIQWRDNESTIQLNDARRLIHTAEIFRQLEGVTSQNAIADASSSSKTCGLYVHRTLKGSIARLANL